MQTKTSLAGQPNKDVDDDDGGYDEDDGGGSGGGNDDDCGSDQGDLTTGDLGPKTSWVEEPDWSAWSGARGSL